MLEILWNNCHTNVSGVMFPVFSVSLGQCRQRKVYFFNVKSFATFRILFGDILQTRNFEQISFCPICFDLWAAPWDVHLHFATEEALFYFEGGKEGSGAKAFLSWGRVFFQTEIHLLYSQLISCVPNTNVIIMSSSTSTTSLSPFYDPGLCDVWPVSREVYLQVEGRERDCSMRECHFDKVR